MNTDEIGSNLAQILERFKIPIALSLVGIVLIIGGIVSSKISSKPAQFPKESLMDSSQRVLSVDVSGAVVKPGVYQLSDGSRIEDAIKAAGGFTENANQNYITKSLNMAQKINDGTKIYVPVTGDSGVVAGTVSSNGAQTAKVNINTASQSELEALPGIGAVTASKIISSRPYQNAEELLGKKVVGKSVYEKIKDSLVVY